MSVNLEYFRSLLEEYFAEKEYGKELTICADNSYLDHPNLFTEGVYDHYSKRYPELDTITVPLPRFNEVLEVIKKEGYYIYEYDNAFEIIISLVNAPTLKRGNSVWHNVTLR